MSDHLGQQPTHEIGSIKINGLMLSRISPCRALAFTLCGRTRAGINPAKYSKRSARKSIRGNLTEIDQLMCDYERLTRQQKMTSQSLDKQ
jgi:hypothetical protein